MTMAERRKSMRRASDHPPRPGPPPEPEDEDEKEKREKIRIRRGRNSRGGVLSGDSGSGRQNVLR